MKNAWDEWFEKQFNKPENKLPQRIKTMHTRYGINENENCCDCIHFYKLGGYAGTYYKCDLTSMTHGSGTDWRINWTACGKFEENK